MAYTLKVTGIATEASSIWAVDDDGTTIKDFVSSTRTSNTTIDAAVTTGAASWKGTSRPYFQTLSNGAFGFKGLTIGSGHEIPYPNNSTGVGIFFALASAQSRSGLSTAILGASIGAVVLNVNGSNKLIDPFSQLAGTTTIPQDNSTAFSFGQNFINGGAITDFYGLESGSLATDGAGTDGFFAGGVNISTVGGVAATGSFPMKIHCFAVFPRALTTLEMQSLHGNGTDDWFSTLFNVSSSTNVFPAIKGDYGPSLIIA